MDDPKRSEQKAQRVQAPGSGAGKNAGEYE